MNLQSISRYISLILRHKPEVINITLNELGDALVNGLNIIFNTTRFTKPMIPVICATIATIGKYFKTTVDMSRHKGQ